MVASKFYLFHCGLHAPLVAYVPFSIQPIILLPLTIAVFVSKDVLPKVSKGCAFLFFFTTSIV